MGFVQHRRWIQLKSIRTGKKSVFQEPRWIRCSHSDGKTSKKAEFKSRMELNPIMHSYKTVVVICNTTLNSSSDFLKLREGSSQA